MSHIKSPARARHTLPETVNVKRSDPVYMAHAYLTKVPVPSIMPFIEEFTKPGDVVLDSFAGSGMTGVAAVALGRSARLFDVSVLGRHIGRNYVNLVDPTELRGEAVGVLGRAVARIGNIYAVSCSDCGQTARLAKTVWSMVMECRECSARVIFYRSLENAQWNKRQMRCTSCSATFSTRARRVDEVPVVDSITCVCSRTQIEQEWSAAAVEPCSTGLEWPDEPIEESRQMYIASALGRHGLTSTASFYSHRNLCALASLMTEIDAVENEGLREKLRFCFTAVLTRASKRYQWSRKRPLNAANSNYYIAPVFYEWNVFDLFSRKVEAAIRSDNWIRVQQGDATLFDLAEPVFTTYDVASADAVPLPDGSVDYVFTDPPFGSNIFYSDMNLFQEVWLGETTDLAQEAVIDRVETGNNRTPERYEELLTDALRECRRIVKPGGYITMVFGTSSGAIWKLAQRSISAAGLVVVPGLISVLNKGQRSLKGLASGFENVVTLDLILTMRAGSVQAPTFLAPPERSDVKSHIRSLTKVTTSSSHLYLELLRHGFDRGWDLSALGLADVINLLREMDGGVEARLVRVT